MGCHSSDEDKNGGSTHDVDNMGHNPNKEDRITGCGLLAYTDDISSFVIQ